MPPVRGNDDGTTGYGVEGLSASAVGVRGAIGQRRERTPLEQQTAAGVAGYGDYIGGHGLDIGGTASIGVYGDSGSGGDGVFGTGTNGVHGSTATPTGYGVLGENVAGTGIRGVGGAGGSAGGSPAEPRFAGVWGDSGGGVGVYGTSERSTGVLGISWSSGDAGVVASNHAGWNEVTTPDSIGLAAYSAGTAVYAEGNPAGYFAGDVQVTGDLILVNSSGDVAEDFDLDDGYADIEPGTVLVISPSGKLRTSVDPYDTRVAGVVSGAGGLTPAVVLQRLEGWRQRTSIALIGKAFCKADASFGDITPGDLLTTSSTPGHAMKVLDHTRATGAILGKALQGLEHGDGLISILVAPR